MPQSPLKLSNPKPAYPAYPLFLTWKPQKGFSSLPLGTTSPPTRLALGLPLGEAPCDMAYFLLQEDNEYDKLLPSHQAFLCTCTLPYLIQINTEDPQNSWKSRDLGSRCTQLHTYWLGDFEQISETIRQYFPYVWATCGSSIPLPVINGKWDNRCKDR